MSISAIYIGADMDIGYTDAENARTGDPLEAGTCTWALTDEDGEEIDSGSLTNDSDNNYYGVIERSVTSDLVDGQKYFLTITFVESTLDDERHFPVFAAYRQ